MERLFGSAGEVGTDMARVSWEQTPLGSPATWPQSLRSVVHVVLTSRFSMWMAGPRLTFICNDKYRRDTLGTKYPWALGRPAAEVWAEIWGDIGPRIETVLKSGVASWDEALLLILERGGYPEETLPHVLIFTIVGRKRRRLRSSLCGQRRHRAGCRRPAYGRPASTWSGANERTDRQ